MKYKFIYFTAIVSFFIVVWHQCAKGAPLHDTLSIGMEGGDYIACICACILFIFMFKNALASVCVFLEKIAPISGIVAAIIILFGFLRMAGVI